MSVTAVIWVNMFGAFLAFVANAWVAIGMRGALRRMFIAIAALALIYAVSFVWLISHLDRAAEWSQFMRPFGLIAWPLAWCVEPFLIRRFVRGKAHEIDELANEVVRRMEKPVPTSRGTWPT